MLIDFNQKQEITVPGMNNGTGTMTAKMYIDEQGKVIPCSIHPGGSIGCIRMKPAMTSIMCCLAMEKPFVMEKKKCCVPELVISVKKARRIVLPILVIRIWFY